MISAYHAPYQGLSIRHPRTLSSPLFNLYVFGYQDTNRHAAGAVQMADPVVIPGGYLNVMVGTVATGGAITYTMICGINTNGLTRLTNVVEQVVPSCDDPEELAETYRTAVSRDTTMTGSGLYTPENVQLLEELNGVSRPYKFQQALPAALTTAGYSPNEWTGNFIMSGFTIAGARGSGGLATVDGLNFGQNGPVTFTPGNLPA